MGATNSIRLMVLRDQLALIQSGDRLLLISLNEKYNSVIPLKSPLDRFLAIARSPLSGVGVEQFIVMTASGMLEIKFNVSRILGGGKE